MFENIKKESISNIIQNFYFAFLGQIIILMGVGYILIDKIETNILIFGASAHLILILTRMFFAYLYKKNEQKTNFLILYSSSLFLSAIAWGSLLIVTQQLSIEFHFLIFAILFALISTAIFLLGEVLYLLFSFLLPIFFIIFGWLIMQDTNKLYVVAFYLNLAFLIYIYITARRYNANHKEILEEKLKSNNLLSILKEKSNSFEVLFEESVNGTLIIEDGVFTQCNKKSIEMMGIDSKYELLGKSIKELSPLYQPDGRLSRDKAKELLAFAIANGHNRFEWLYIRMDKKVFLAEVNFSLITLNSKKVIYVSWQDITKEKRLKDSLNRQVNYDLLTMLPNRILFHDRLSQGIIKANRRNYKLAIFFLDIDNFKHINDSLGHGYGDKVLKYFAKLLKKQIRSEDTLARFGGDEFTIIMENFKNLEDVSRLAQKIINSFVRPMIIDKIKYHVSASIGISLFPQDDTNEINLLKYADIAMYKAKDSGRNNFQFYSSEMTDIIEERLYIENSLRNAIDNDEFSVSYQPQINAINSKIIGIEALVRWEHPKMGLVPPIKFISIAENAGLMFEIDKRIRKLAMSQVAYWYEMGLNPGVLSLNLSPKQLDRDDFLDELNRNIYEACFKAEWLELEITESEIMRDPERSIDKLKRIFNLGVKIVIDDFGTGHSSLSYLKRLPITKLKIDQSFIKDIPYNEDDKAITKAVISLSKSLNLDIIAEGVETLKQKEFLIEEGCNNIQGFLYSKPLSAQELEKIIKLGEIKIG